MSEKPERQRIVEEAIEWMVRLQSGDFSAAEGDALERWKALSSEHAEVFRQLLGSLAPLQDSPWRGQPSANVLRALEQPSSRRRGGGGGVGPGSDTKHRTHENEGERESGDRQEKK
ncbi:FecR/PupR family sigma factor regulator, partial [Pseudomonas aeruginosa]